MTGVGFRPLSNSGNIVNTVEGVLVIIFKFFFGGENF